MAYRLNWAATLDWLPPGIGPTTGAGLPQPNGNSQTKGFVQTVVLTAPGQGAGGALNAADIAALVAGLTADLTAQLSANPAFTQMGQWPTGAP
jgi:hypothetical protein